MLEPIGKRSRKNAAPNPTDAISDPRFSNIQSDPRFRLPSKRNTHVQIDKRFAPILEDEAFSSKAKVDRYGRKLSKGKAKHDLRKFYRMEDEEAADAKEIDDQSIIDDELVERELRRLGDGEELVGEVEESDTESSDSSSEEDDDHDPREEGNDAVFGVAEGTGEDGGAIPQGEVSSRLAVVNLDWDNIHAPDLMAVFQSFIPTNGHITKVAIYPSEFGKERLEREEIEGPPQEIFAHRSGKSVDMDDALANDLDSEDAEEDDERVKQSILKEDTGAEFSSTQLRRYQISRLRYYYAVISCSSASAASAIYDAVDGTEYLTTANFFDLRYIPEEMGFEEDVPRDECTRLPDGYRPNDFVTEALQHSKVKLTWDADDATRKEVQKRAFGGSRKDIDDNDLKAYLGSDSEDDNDDQGTNENASAHPVAIPDSTATLAIENPPPLSKKEAERQRKRALLGLPTSPDLHPRKPAKDAPVGDMQVTFTSGLSGSASGPDHTVFENSPERDETTVEKYVRKEKERKAKRREKTKASRTAGVGAGVEDGEAAASEDQPTRAEGKTVPTTALKETGKNEQDLGFNDPFFTQPDPPTTNPSTTKAARRQTRLEREDAESSAALERAKLERLIASPSNNDQGPDGKTETIKHFSAPHLARAEKLSRKKSLKKKKLTPRDKEALAAAAADDFKMDVKDERFRDVFERAEFAIDPSHPRFSGSVGMRGLVGEGRRRRGGSERLSEDDEGRGKRGRERGEEGDVGELVRKVKKKVRV